MADESTSLAIARIEFLEAARSSENELLAQRATWLVLAQSFLFATFAIVVGQVEQRQDADPIPWLLFRIIPIVGLSIAVLVELAVGAAIYMLWTLHRQLVALEESPDVVAVRWPSSRRPAAAMILGQLPSIVAPVGLAIVWGVLLAQPGPPG